MHDVGITFLRDKIFGRLRLAARVNDGSRARERFRLQHVVFDGIIFAAKGKMIVAPNAIHHVQPLRGARIAVIVLLEVDAILFGFIRPPG